MTFTHQISAARERLQARTENYRQAALAAAETAVSAARGTVLSAADRVADARQPIRTIAVAGQRLSSVSNRYFTQLFGQQAHVLEGVVQAGSERLKRIAKSDSLAELVAEQRELGTASRKRLSADLKATWQIATQTGMELRDLAVETYAELVEGVKPRRAAATRTQTVRAKAKRPAAKRRKSTRARKAR